VVTLRRATTFGAKMVDAYNIELKDFTINWEFLYSLRNASLMATGEWLESWGPTKEDYIKYVGQEHYDTYAEYVYTDPEYATTLYNSIEDQKQKEIEAAEFVKQQEALVKAAEEEVARKQEEAKAAAEEAQRAYEISVRDDLYNKITLASDQATSDVANYLNYTYYNPAVRGVFTGTPDVDTLISNRLADYITESEMSKLTELSGIYGSLGDVRQLGQSGFFDPFTEEKSSLLNNVNLESEQSTFLAA